MTTKTSTMIIAGCLLAVATLVRPAVADPDLPRSVLDLVAALQDRAETLGEEAQSRSEPLPEGESKQLRAVVMQTAGRSQWRPNAEAAWKNAKVDDMLDAGAMVRTGRKSRMTLRVGQNATVLVDRNTRLVLPQIIQSGASLKTMVQVTRGRADFKVDRVGLTNDFSVVTPSTTLAVRGTGFGVDYGGFDGTQISASRLNEMFAIEVRFFLDRFSHYLSGGAAASDEHPNPAVAELFRSFGPPQIVSALIEDDATPQLLAELFTRNPALQQRQVDLQTSSLMNIEELPVFVEPSVPPGSVMPVDPSQLGFNTQFGTLGEIAELMCTLLDDLFSYWGSNLVNAGLGNNNLNLTRRDVDAICANAAGQFEDQDLIEILTEIVAYCETEHAGNETNISRCVEEFFQSFVTVYEGYGGNLPPGSP